MGSNEDLRAPPLTLDAIADAPTAAFGLPRETLAILIARAGAAQAALLAALAGSPPEPGAAPADDQLLDVEAASAMLAVSPEWLYRRGKTLGLGVQLGPGTVRFSGKAIAEFIRRKKVPAMTRTHG